MDTKQHDPEFTSGDRYRKARENAGLSQKELASEIAVSERTISRCETDAVRPRRIVTRQWALRCGVREEWLDPHPRAAGRAKSRAEQRKRQSRCSAEMAGHPLIPAAA